jgi:hypothetical protein
LGAHLNTRFSTFCSTNFAALLLQQILAAKSLAFVSMHELNEFFRRHSDRKDSKQRANPGAMVGPGLRQHHDELEKLHDDWTDFDDGEIWRGSKSHSLTSMWLPRKQVTRQS